MAKITGRLGTIVNWSLIERKGIVMVFGKTYQIDAGVFTKPPRHDEDITGLRVVIPPGVISEKLEKITGCESEIWRKKNN